MCIADSSPVKTYSYGIDNEADIKAVNVNYTNYGSSYRIITEKKGGIDVKKIPLPGKIYVYNTLAAFGVLYMMGLSLEKKLSWLRKQFLLFLDVWNW